VYHDDVNRGLRELERTLEINPFLARAHLALGNRLDLVGRSAEGIEKLRTALELNPREPERQLYMVRLARGLIVEAKYEEALDWIEQAISLRPDTADFHYRQAVCLAHLDRVDEARAALEACDHLQPGLVGRRSAWHPYSDDARNRRFFAGLVRHGLL
jgi:Flp pilus assembly protein TadD